MYYKIEDPTFAMYWDDFNVNKCLTYQREGWGVYEMADTHLWLQEKAFFSGLKI